MLKLVTTAASFLSSNRNILSILDNGFQAVMRWRRAAAMNKALTYAESAAKILDVLATAAPAARAILAFLLAAIGSIYNFIQRARAGETVEVNDVGNTEPHTA